MSETVQSSNDPDSVRVQIPMQFHSVLAKCTVRARVAFVLAIAETETQVIDADENIANRIRTALELAWEWEERGNVSGDLLYHTLENEKGDGLLVYEFEAANAIKPAWVTITSAIAYTAWHAYVCKKIKFLPEPMYEINEEIIDQAVLCAKRAPGFDPQFLEVLVRYCIENHRSGESNSLGRSIPRDEILSAAGVDRKTGTRKTGGSDH
jgi:hypothetical protein